jgi:DNA recombination protein RmuC
VLYFWKSKTTEEKDMISIALAILIALLFGILCGLALFVLMLISGRERNARLLALTAENERLLPFQKENEGLKIEHARFQERIESEQTKTEWVETAETKLREAFTALAATALQANSSQFVDQSKREVKGIVDPLNKDLEKLESQVRALEQKREGAYSGLLSEIGNLKQGYSVLNTTTLNLQQALKSTTSRGKWGEIQLKRIVEMSGMVDHIDFTEQTTTDSGSRPDLIVRLPSNAIIPVDAKVPMKAYLDAIASTNPDEAARLLNQHRIAVREHVKSLSKKSYWAQFDDAAEFVVMFIPYESGLEASFAHDPMILDEALANKVIIVSPSTLLALLKVIAYGWLQLQLAKNARAITDVAKELMERLATFLGHFKDVGSKISGTLDSYNKAVGSLDGRVMPSIRKLKEMGASSEDIPEVKHIENRARLVDSVGSGPIEP